MTTQARTGIQKLVRLASRMFHDLIGAGVTRLERDKIAALLAELESGNGAEHCCAPAERRTSNRVADRGCPGNNEKRGPCHVRQGPRFAGLAVGQGC
jgi:hypothetical protein